MFLNAIMPSLHHDVYIVNKLINKFIFEKKKIKNH